VEKKQGATLFIFSLKNEEEEVFIFSCLFAIFVQMSTYIHMPTYSKEKKRKCNTNQPHGFCLSKLFSFVVVVLRFPKQITHFPGANK
jgi:hypothetical protein